MKKLTSLLLLTVIAAYSTAQITSVDDIKVVQSEFYSTKDSTLRFPIFRLKNKKAEHKINQRLRDDFKKDRDIEKKVTDIRRMLEQAGKENLTDLDYEVVYQNQKLISLSFQWEAIGAYSSSWKTYYCFNLETGNLVTLDSLINTSYKGAFLSLAKNKQSTSISLYKKELQNQLRKKEIDKETYNWVIDQITNNCWGNYDPQKFTIDKSSITIIIDCDFPHAIKALSPGNEIKIPLKQMEQYLNKRYKL